ncbi:hypothetical protein Droror1_Dr00005628 [Drosera rotundifolia]
MHHVRLPESCEPCPDRILNDIDDTFCMGAVDDNAFHFLKGRTPTANRCGERLEIDGDGLGRLDFPSNTGEVLLGILGRWLDLMCVRYQIRRDFWLNKRRIRKTSNIKSYPKSHVRKTNTALMDTPSYSTRLTLIGAVSVRPVTLDSEHVAVVEATTSVEVLCGSHDGVSTGSICTG